MMPVRSIVDLRSGLAGVRDQGNRPTCLAHSISAAHEYKLGAGVSLSPEYLHYFASDRQPDRGSRFTKGLESVRDEGQPSETDCPYQQVLPSSGWRPPTGIRLHRRDYSLVSPSFDLIIEALNGGQPVILGIGMPEDFRHPKAPWLFDLCGKAIDLHAVVAVGHGTYDGQKVIVIRNSWGADWADGGYAYVSRGFIDFYLRDIAYLGEAVT